MQASLSLPRCILVYDESRRYEIQLVGQAAWDIHQAMIQTGEPYKCFMYAVIGDDGLPRLLRQAPWQEW